MYVSDSSETRRSSKPSILPLQKSRCQQPGPLGLPALQNKRYRSSHRACVKSATSKALGVFLF